MTSLNYHHLYLFWVVAREGGVARAAERLRLAHATISEQVHALEAALGEKLLLRVGRRLELTEMGRTVFRYADDIFALGRELVDVVGGRPTGRPLRLAVGIADVVPKLVARRLLQPALRSADPVHLVCREDRPERLLAELALHAIDVVISDAPAVAGSPVRVYDHLLGESSVGFFGTRPLAARHRRGWPGSLDGAPVLLPTENTMLRRALDRWLAERNLRPRVVAECEDSALLQVLGEDGLGLFPAHTVIAREIRRNHAVELVGRVDPVRERFYAISAERRLEHPAVVAISEAAQREVFR